MKRELYGAVIIFLLPLLTACCCIDKTAMHAVHRSDELFTGSASTPTYEIVKFEHVEFDVLNEYNGDTRKFIAKQDGYYLVLIGIDFYGLGENNGTHIQVFINDNPTAHLSYSNLLLNNHQNPNQRLSTVVKLNKDDVLDIRVSPLNRIDGYMVSHISQLSDNKNSKSGVKINFTTIFEKRCFGPSYLADDCSSTCIEETQTIYLVS